MLYVNTKIVNILNDNPVSALYVYICALNYLTKKPKFWVWEQICNLKLYCNWVVLSLFVWQLTRYLVIAMLSLLAGTANQPLFLVFLCRCMSAIFFYLTWRGNALSDLNEIWQVCLFLVPTCFRKLTPDWFPVYFA